VVVVTWAGELIKDLGLSPDDDTSSALWVADVAGDTVYTINFSGGLPASQLPVVLDAHKHDCQADKDHGCA
jgi:hypothetical protein